MLSNVWYLGFILHFFGLAIASCQAFTILPDSLFLTGWYNNSSPFDSATAIMYWYPLLDWYGNLPVWSESIYCLDSYSTSKILTDISLSWVVDEQSDSSSSGDCCGFVLVDFMLALILRMCPFCVSSNSGKCVSISLAVKPGQVL